MSPFATYTKVHSEEEAKELIELLDTSDIPYQVENNKDILDRIYIGDSMDPMISIKIPDDEFVCVNELLKDQAKKQVHTLNADYYLFHFTDQELLDVVQNPNEWNAFDQGVAEKLLSERNVEIEQLSDAEFLEAAYTPIKLKGIYVVLQYLLSVILLYAGIVIGLATLYAYRTLSNGKKVKMYDDETREHGKFMILIGVVRVLIELYMYYSLS